MTSKEALEDLFTISNKITKDKLNLDTKEIFERYKVIREDLEFFETLKKIAYGVGTEEDLAVARKHFEMETKQALEKSNEGYTYIKLGEIMDRRNNYDR